MTRIAVTGPESCGKTTLSLALSEMLNAQMIPEYARSYLEQNEGRYVYHDLEIMAEEQVLQWDNSSNSIIVCDTDMTVFKIWSEVKFGKLSNRLRTLYLQQHFDYYFLCYPDIPWDPDPLREDPFGREVLFNKYEQELIALNRSYTILKGTKEERLKQATEILFDLNFI